MGLYPRSKPSGSARPSPAGPAAGQPPPAPAKPAFRPPFPGGSPQRPRPGNRTQGRRCSRAASHPRHTKTDGRRRPPRRPKSAGPTSLNSGYRPHNSSGNGIAWAGAAHIKAALCRARRHSPRCSKKRGRRRRRFPKPAPGPGEHGKNKAPPRWFQRRSAAPGCWDRKSADRHSAKWNQNRTAYDRPESGFGQRRWASAPPGGSVWRTARQNPIGCSQRRRRPSGFGPRRLPGFPAAAGRAHSAQTKGRAGRWPCR